MCKHEYYHLHCHTTFSLFDGSIKPKELVELAIQRKQKAIVITDHGTLNAIYEVQEEIKKQGADIKLVVGMEAYLGIDTRSHILLLVKNEIGFRNLIELYDFSMQEENLYKKRIPTITLDFLIEHKEGLIVTSACVGGFLGDYILESDFEKAWDLAVKFKIEFQDDFYLEIQPHDTEEQRIVNNKLLELSERLDIEVVGTMDCHFLTREEKFAHEILTCSGKGKSIYEEHFIYKGFFHYADSEEMEQLFKEALKEKYNCKYLNNTRKIVEQCNLTFNTEKKFPVMYETNEEATKVLKAKLNKWYVEFTKDMTTQKKIEIRERLREELDVISNASYSNYLLIVEDLLNNFQEIEVDTFGVMMKLETGIGRGSCVGSLICFALNITKVNPLEYGLLFERFLNKERLSAVDIDFDMCYEYRHLGLEYVQNKYGMDNIANVCTYQNLLGKAILRRVLKAFGHANYTVDKIAEMLKNEEGTLEEVIELLESFQIYGKEIEVIKMLYGGKSANSVHASGVIISPVKIKDVAPTYYHQEKKTNVLCMDKKVAENNGFLKFDFLGLKTLTVFRIAKALVKKNKGIDVDLTTIDLEDKEIFKTINSDNITGLFQLDGATAKQMIKKVGAECFMDIVSINAIARPGVQESEVQMFLTKANKKYGYKEIDEILENTYGAILFQEQTMKLMNVVTGGKWTLGKADKLRKVKDLNEYKEDFFNCSPYPLEITEDVWSRFSLAYSFNMSHAVAYSVIGMQTAYLLTYFPLEFMTAYLNVYSDTEASVTTMMEQVKALGYSVKLGDINAKIKGFYCEDNTLYYGLNAIKGVGDNALEKLITSEVYINSYKDIVDNKVGNKTLIVALIKLGLLGENRLEVLREYYSTRAKKEREKELALIDGLDEEVYYKWERELLGFYLSQNPLEKNWANGCGIGGIGDLNEEEVGSIVAQIDTIKTITNKKGQPMSFLTATTRNGKCEVVVFSKVFHIFNKIIEKDNIYIIKGKKENGNKIIADTFKIIKGGK